MRVAVCAPQHGFLQEAAHCTSAASGELASMTASFENIANLTERLSASAAQLQAEGSDQVKAEADAEPPPS